MTKKRWGEGVYNLISWFDIGKVAKATVMVVGAGALGNEVLKNLALLGVGNIIIVDFDRIEYSNLTRSVLFRTTDAEKQAYKSEIAAERIKEINPEINVIWLNGDIEKEVGLGYFRASNVIIGCLDSILARYVVNNYAFRLNKPWIDGGIRNLDGHASVYDKGKACYACSLADESKQNMAIREGCADVFQESLSFGRVATTPISASIIGAVQVQEALKIIHGYKDGDRFENFQVCRSLNSKSFYYEGMNMDAYSIISPNYFDNCPHHDSWENIIEDINITTKTTIQDLFVYFEKRYGDNIEKIYLRNPFITHILIRPEERKYEAMIPDSKVQEFILKNDIKIGLEETAYKLPSPEGGYYFIDESFKWKNLTLEQVGVPDFDILHIETKSKDYYIELTSESF
ncbi:MAG: ThiF family adenylyltransferase [Mariniphaga sp.]|nr:ThiF family adenylyltransferase [Mariniphaga sp.]